MLGKSLAHVEKIVDVYAIEGADAIEMAQVLDYHVVVKKGEFKVGDLALYIEIDSKVPDGLPEKYKAKMKELIVEFHNSNKEERVKIEQEMENLSKHSTIPEFEFLRKRRFKIKQIKYGRFNIYSQGILFPLHAITTVDLSTAKVGHDATDELNITKIIEDVVDSGVDDVHIINKILDNVPVIKFINKKLLRYEWYREFRAKYRKPTGKWHDNFPSKSDESNIQHIFTDMKNKHGDKLWYVSEKLEGQNISIVSKLQSLFGLINKTHIGVCSHHRYIPTYDGSNFWKTVRRLGIDSKLKSISGNWFIRGEHVGPSIQGNIYAFDNTDIYVFDVYDMNSSSKQRLSLDDAIAFCDTHGFKFVPILDREFKLPDTVNELLEYSNGYSVFGNKVRREGVVIRLLDDPNVSFKVRSPVYLDKHS